MNSKLNRRQFTRICSSMIACAVTGPTIPATGYARTAYPATKLLDNNKLALKAESLETGVPYVFFYPFVTTPCFLIDLGTTTGSGQLNDRAGNKYQWHGGIGPQGSIVAYSAICSHKMSHPAKEISFINYRHDKISFYSHEGKTVERNGIISCCSERSVYDPRQGAKVLAGPAPQPLAAIELQIDEGTGELFATASYGGDMYETFFEKFGFRAAIEHRIDDPKKLSGKTTPVQKITEYSRQTIKC